MKMISDGNKIISEKALNICHNLNDLDNSLALKIWFFLDMKDIDCFWIEELDKHTFVARNRALGEVYWVDNSDDDNVSDSSKRKIKLLNMLSQKR